METRIQQICPPVEWEEAFAVFINGEEQWQIFPNEEEAKRALELLKGYHGRETTRRGN